jgi:tetratricopeptide (TPR) repeat protein
MKNRLLTAIFALSALGAFAQQGNVDDAKTDYTKFDGLRSNMALAKPSLMSAKASIDKASTNKKTANSPQMFALKAAIYASLATTETDASASATDYSTAMDALKQARTTDTKNENTNMIQHASIELAQVQLDKGVKAFQAKNYDEAYKAFDAGRQIAPEDTLLILYSAISATNAKNYPAAISNYNKLVTTNYSKKVDAYNDLTTIYLYNKDTANAVKTISEAATKYPNNTDLRKREIEVSLQAGQLGDLVGKIDAAIKADPNNKALYYYEGLTYSQAGEAAGNSIKKLQKGAKAGTKPDPQITKLQQTRRDNFEKAADNYKKAIAIDPNYFEAVMNLGYVTMTPAIDTYNEAQQLPVNQTKAYNDAMAKAKAQFDLAKPYLLKAVELNPNSLDALTNLKSYYLGVRDDADANATQKKIDALPKQ